MGRKYVHQGGLPPSVLLLTQEMTYQQITLRKNYRPVIYLKKRKEKYISPIFYVLTLFLKRKCISVNDKLYFIGNIFSQLTRQGQEQANNLVGARKL